MSHARLSNPETATRPLLSSFLSNMTSGLLRLVAVAALALTLTACGWGGGGSSTGSQTYGIAGYVTGLNPWMSLTLLNNGADADTVPTNGMFLFSSTLATGAAYAITVGSQPLHQTCTVTNGTGTVGSSNVTNIAVTCTTGPQFAYVANLGGNTVSAYSINPTTGALTPVTGSPFTTGIFPDAVTVNTTGTFAYVANSGDATVSAYSIDATTGALTPVAGSPFATGSYPQYVVVAQP